MIIKMKLGNLAAIAICLTVISVIFSACSAENDNNMQNKVLNITAINHNTSEIVTRNLKSMEEKTFSIVCHVLSSTTFDVRSHSFGYADCNNTYRFIDIETGEEIKQISLPGILNLMVLDMTRNQLIGHYYDDIEDGKNYVVTIDLNNVDAVSDKQLYVNGAWNGTVHFFRDIENEYVLLHPDSGLVFINPPTGNIVRTLSLETTCINNGVYDRKNNRLIGTTCLNEMSEKYIVAIDLNTGNTLSKVLVEDIGFDSHFVAGEMDYDTETNSYILLSENNEVLFFDVATGKVKDRYQLDFDAVSLKIWRNSK